jgi:glycosyl hydrolase family 114
MTARRSPSETLRPMSRPERLAAIVAHDLAVSPAGGSHRGRARGDRLPRRRGGDGPTMRALLAALALGLALAAPAEGAKPPPTNAGFDYQIGGDYELPAGVSVVSRDWYIGLAPRGTYAICYVNAFQTQDEEPGVRRRDERSAWPSDLVLGELGDDPNWGGEYLVDIGTAAKRKRAARWVQPMIRTCAKKGFEAVEYDNLDSWTRFDGTPRDGDVPFGKADAIAYAKLLARRAHKLGLAVGQKNRRADFEKTCAQVGSRISVVLRDVNVTRPGSGSYVYDSC